MDGAQAATGQVREANGTAGRSGSGRWWAIIAISVSVLVVGLDLTVLSLALPTISVDLHASTSSLQWITDSYSLVLAAGILPAGILGDTFGRKKLLIGALVLFGLSSAACAYATSAGELIAARALLGVGASAVFPLSLSVIPVLFGPDDRKKAITAVASATMLSFPIGPIVGGYLLDHFWWGSVFLINVPVVALALIAVTFLLPESRSEQRARIDVVGVLISCAGLIALTFGLIKADENGWSDTAALATIVAGALVLAGFVWWERFVDRRGAIAGGQSTRPLVQLDLFRSEGFRWGTILATLVSFVMFGLLFAMPQYFQDVKGVDALGSGFRLLPLIGGMLVAMIAGVRLKINQKVATTVGFALLTAGLWLGATSTAGSGAGFSSAWMAIAGAGLGLAMPSAMNAAVGALSAERSGAGSALISALRQVGATIGVALLGTILANGYTSRLHLPASVDAVARRGVAAGVGVATHLRSDQILEIVRTAFTHGMDVLLATCGGIALASALLALIFLPRRAR
jgi:MFS transporter, DHA2 family, multidrug resistance protein